MPYIGINAEAVISKCENWTFGKVKILTLDGADNGGVCDTQKEFGVEVGANFGAELSIKAANVEDPANELLDLTLAVSFFADLRVLRINRARQWIADQWISDHRFPPRG